MIQQVTLPVLSGRPETDLYPGGWWHRDGDRVVCDLCPRECSLKEGDRGFCFVRQRVDDGMVLTTYGRSTGFCVDPIEKKPLNHFYPGTSVLSFGTAGCNLGCKFCQNWDISKSREIERLSAQAMPDHIAYAAKQLGCHSVAFTYNDPIIWAEYAMETADACHAEGIKTVAVTAGYITEEARGPFFDKMDAANVDLKAFTEEFYHKITLSHLEPILNTLRWLKAETDVWFEITNLVIPETNDDTDEFRRMCDWVLENVGDEVPVHFTAFHPDFRMLDKPRTPHETLIFAREIALEKGLKYVYVGNVHDVMRQSTYCPNCSQLLIERDWHALGKYALAGNLCTYCGTRISGFFADKPGTWGRRRLPVDMRKFLPPGSPQPTATVRTSTANSNQRHTEMPDVTQAPPALESLTDEQQAALLTAAGEILKSATLGREPQLSDPAIDGLADQPVWGIFVTVKRNGHLRSCCGSFGRSGPLGKTLCESAVRTATNDPRFPPLSPSELPHLELDVWLLHEPEEVAAQGEDRLQEVTVGVHGLQVIRGNSRGLLLPSVPIDAGWETEEFLNRVCIKASLTPTAWREPDTTLIRFRGDCVEAKLGDVLGMKSASLPTPLYNVDQLNAYAGFCRATIAAFVSGGTPNPYFTAVPDANVSGVAISASLPGTEFNQTLWELTMRGKNPLQASLHSVCKKLAGGIKRRGVTAQQCEQLQIGVTVLDDPAMHGTAADPDLAGVDSASRGVMVRERNRSAWIFDKHRTPAELLQQAAEMAEVAEPEFSAVFSFAVVSTQNPVVGSSVPRAVAGPDVRRPAVAGRFYPGKPAEVSKAVDELLGEKVPREKWTAAIVPHAGWKFSGKIAADVLKRIEYPANVIIIGPKHTAMGVEWAVAPNLVWGLPNGNLGANERIAKALASTIPGLQLDSQAHQQEHGIEVELPFIQRLAPKTRVVGITIGSATKERCEQFAEGLAEFIRGEQEPPLLIISSDMNHYASDAETRRLDELALERLDVLDADGLYDVCTAEHISMCGMRPAVMIFKALQKLGRVSTCERVGYATSADVTGDTTRVVGYAGMLFR